MFKNLRRFKKFTLFGLFICLVITFWFYKYVQNKMQQEIGPIVYRTIPPSDFSPNTVELILDKRYSNYQKIHVDQWTDIGDPKKRCRMFSAYYDPRLEILANIRLDPGEAAYGSIRIIAILPLLLRGYIYCNFKHSPYNHTRQLADFVEPITENGGLNFTATFVVCKLLYNKDHKTLFLPGEVGLSYDAEPSMVNATSFIRIHYPGQEVIDNPVPQQGLAVCIGPVHNNYTNALRVVEYIEYWRWHGSARFFFYNQSATEPVNRVMRYYQRKKLAEVFEWNVMEDYKHEKELRYAGIFAAINDCVYRAAMLENYRFVAVVDLDEFIFPLVKLNQPLIQYLHHIDTNAAHSFHFRAVFFYSSADNFTGIPVWAVNKYLYTQVRTMRTRDAMPLHTRSKYIAKGRKVIEAGNHFVWRALDGTAEILIPEDEALVYHYRDKCPDYECNDLVRDGRAHRNWWLLWHAVDRVCQRVFPTDNGLCPLGTPND